MDTVEQFMHTMQEFLSSLREVYPECLRVIGYDYAFRKKVAGLSKNQLHEIGVGAMASYRDTMSPWYARCTQKDPGLLAENIQFLRDLDLSTKWAGMDADTQDTIWEYIIRLNQYCGGPAEEKPEELDISKMPGMPAEMAKLLDIMPHSLKLGISATSTRYATKIKNGEMTFAEVNIMQMAKEMGGAINDEDMQAFGQSLQAGNVNLNVASLTNMVSQMDPGEVPPGMMSAITGLLGNK